MGRHLWLTQMVQSYLHLVPTKLNRRIKTTCSHDKFWIVLNPSAKCALGTAGGYTTWILLEEKASTSALGLPSFSGCCWDAARFKLQHWAEMSQGGTLTVQQVAGSQPGVSWSVRAQTFWTPSPKGLLPLVQQTLLGLDVCHWEVTASPVASWCEPAITKPVFATLKIQMSASRHKIALTI